MKKIISIATIIAMITVLSVAMPLSVGAYAISTTPYTESFDTEGVSYATTINSGMSATYGQNACDGTILWSSEDAKTGSNSAKIKFSTSKDTNTGIMGGKLNFGDGSKTWASGTYTVSFWVKYVDKNNNTTDADSNKLTTAAIGYYPLNGNSYVALNDANGTSLGAAYKTINMGEWTKISRTFAFDPAKLTTGNAVWFRIQYQNSTALLNGDDVMYVDDVEVTANADTGTSYFAGHGTYNFDTVSALSLCPTSTLTASVDNVNGVAGMEYNTNAGTLSMDSDVYDGTSGKSVKVSGFAGAYSRLSFFGLIPDTDVGKTIKLTFRIYTTEEGKQIYAGIKGDAVTNNCWITKQTISPAANTWTTVELTGSISQQSDSYTIGGVSNTAFTAISSVFALSVNGVAIDNRMGNFYIDNITVNEGVPESDTFAGLSTTGSQTFEDVVSIKSDDYTKGGEGNTNMALSISTAENHTPGGTKSLCETGRTAISCRPRLLGVFTSADVGKTFVVSAYFKPSIAAKIGFGAINTGFNYSAYAAKQAPADAWTKVTFAYTVDADHLNLSFDQAGLAGTTTVAETIYVDDITITECSFTNNTTNFVANIPVETDDTTASVIVAAYDADGNLIGVTVAPYEADSDYSITVNCDTTKVSKVRAMAWNMSSLYPSASVVEYKPGF